MYIPDRWAHATCGLSNFNVGVGFIGSISSLPPLHRASVIGDLPGALQTLQSLPWSQMLRPAGPGMLNEDGLLPLQWAAWNGHLSLVRLLLQAEEVAEMVDGAGSIGSLDFGAAHALGWAAARGHVPVVAFLVRRAGHARDEQGAMQTHADIPQTFPKVLQGPPT